MNQIDNISSEANQLTVFTLADGSAITITLYYRPTIQRWTADIAYGTFTLNGIMLCNHPNLLRTFRQIIPFGLACTSNDGVDPIRFDDFSTGRSQLFILEAADVTTVEIAIGLS